MTHRGSVVIKLHDEIAQSEAFEAKRLADSIEAACLSVGLAHGLAEDTAKHAVKAVELWLVDRPEVTSDDIRRIATRALTIVSPEAAYLYKHHHTML
ncbi:MAG TPA: hypothetical protein VL362_00010 [Patescibacteria group bacterium]|jgi:CTP:molybdopterin cytidylyltransferase MocA|nr:hypothetical protein [Patescibacteria group bacterium]